MKNEINVSDLVSSIAEEKAQKSALSKTAGLKSLRERLSGDHLSKTAEDANIVASEIAGEIGAEGLSMSNMLEKIATDMENADTTDDIIKIAKELGNSDFEHLSTIATKLADVVIADIQNKIDI